MSSHKTCFTKNNLLLLLLVCLFCAIVIISYFYYSKPSNPVSSPPTIEKKTDFKIKDKALLPFEGVNCSIYSDEERYYTCVAAQPLPKYYSTLAECMQIEAFESRQNCIDRHYHIQSKIQSNISLCIGIINNNTRYACFTEFIPLFGNYTCTFLTSEEDLEHCFAKVALHFKNIDLCESIDDPYEAHECKDRIKSTLAQRSFDVALCKSLTVLEYRNLCLYSFYSTLGVERCDFMQELADTCRNKLILDQATTEKNLSRCKTLTNITFRTVCENFMQKPYLPPTHHDSDNDTIDDFNELFMNIDPLNPDTDGDGLTDGYELTHHLDPSIQDTDGDGILDGNEVIKDD